VLGTGYSVAALAPVGLGAVRDLTGSFSGALWTLVGVAVALIALLARRDAGADPTQRPRTAEPPTTLDVEPAPPSRR
jgi:cyanate permease